MANQHPSFARMPKGVRRQLPFSVNDNYFSVRIASPGNVTEVLTVVFPRWLGTRVFIAFKE
jgi:hypothetical protein